MISESVVVDFIHKIDKLRQNANTDFFSKTRDVFDARLATYTAHSQNWLLGAVIGKIGANTFDHNFAFRSEFPRGLFFDSESDSRYIFLCDFGAGLKTTLSRVVHEIDSDEKAIETAFTKPISGRAPELRGNGLKFVISSVVENNWHLYFQSGYAVCKADKNGYYFEKSAYYHNGCFCILSNKEAQL